MPCCDIICSSSSNKMLVKIKSWEITNNECAQQTSTARGQQVFTDDTRPYPVEKVKLFTLHEK